MGPKLADFSKKNMPEDKGSPMAYTFKDKSGKSGVPYFNVFLTNSYETSHFYSIRHDNRAVSLEQNNRQSATSATRSITILCR